MGMNPFLARPPSSGRIKFRVMKRETNGETHAVGLTYADNKHQADFKARAVYKPKSGEAVWCEETINEEVYHA